MRIPFFGVISLFYPLLTPSYDISTGMACCRKGAGGLTDPPSSTNVLLPRETRSCISSTPQTRLEHFGTTLIYVSTNGLFPFPELISESATQYCDGLRGPFIIYDPDDPHAGLYDVDDGSPYWYLMLLLFVNRVLQKRQSCHYRTGIIPQLNSLVFREC